MNQEQFAESVAGRLTDGPCQECGEAYPIWFTDNAVWNYVLSGGTSTREQGGMLCPRCFMAKAEPLYAAALTWRIAISDPSVNPKAEAWSEGYRAGIRSGESGYIRRH